jgi:hypothetical protein
VASKASQAVQSLDRELLELRNQTYGMVLELPAFRELPDASIGKKHTVAMWKTELANGAVRVVVQSHLRFILGVGRMAAGGYEFRSDGSVVEVADQDLMEYR